MSLSNNKKELIRSKYQEVKNLLDKLHEEFKEDIITVSYQKKISIYEDEKDNFCGMELDIFHSSNPRECISIR